MKSRANTPWGCETHLARPRPSRPDDGRATSLARILVPIDFSSESRKALEYARMFARQFGAGITLLHVVGPIVCEADYGYGLVTNHIPDQALLRKANTRLGTWRKRLLAPNMDVAVLARTGRSHSEIIRTAKDSEIDLIIMGTHRHSKSEQMPPDSTTEKVVRHAPCPVLIVRKKQRELAE